MLKITKVLKKIRFHTEKQKLGPPSCPSNKILPQQVMLASMKLYAHCLLLQIYLSLKFGSKSNCQMGFCEIPGLFNLLNHIAFGRSAAVCSPTCAGLPLLVVYFVRQSILARCFFLQRILLPHCMNPCHFLCVTFCFACPC